MSSKQIFTISKILNIFGATDVDRHTLMKAADSGRLPPPLRESTGKISRRVWEIQNISPIGAEYGFMKKPDLPLAITVYVQKGGVLKTTLSLNLARMAALHDIKTCVVGLDSQCDLTSAMGYEPIVDEDRIEDLDSAIKELAGVRGLFDVFQNSCSLDEVIQSTDLPTLSFIPETTELTAMDYYMVEKTRREEWLNYNIIQPLKKKFDLIVIDCPPNWNRLITNALFACDIVVSPVECKINHFNNLKYFQKIVAQFRKDARTDFEHIYIPTKHAAAKTLSDNIRRWYLTNLPGCSNNSIRESVASEEAIASHVSLPEYAPTSLQADEMRTVLKELWARALKTAQRAVSEEQNSFVPRKKSQATLSSQL